MYFIILLLILVDWQGNVVIASDTEKPNTDLSEIENKQNSLSIEMDILKADSSELRNLIETLNTTCHHGVCKKEYGDIAFASINASSKERAENYLMLDKILKAFKDEKKFYRKSLGDSETLQKEIRRELETLIHEFDMRLQDWNRNISIIDLEHKFEQCYAHELKVTALKAEINTLRQNSENQIRQNSENQIRQNSENQIRQNSENQIRQLKEKYTNLENKFKLFQENVMDNFVTEEKFIELQEMHSGQGAVQKLVFQCDGSWVFSFDTKTCFMFVTKGLTWHSAVMFCKTHEGQLVQIEDSKKQAHVAWLYEESGLYWGYDWTSFWAGGSDSSVEGWWRWIESKEKFTWSNWDRYYEEPNGGSDENCLSVLLSYNYFQWNDEECTYKLPFICEKILS